ncbi:MAG: ester cyclase [Acidobacteria bacterium]|nr:ester cyclase [Acidobacteriota bacterium]
MSVPELVRQFYDRIWERGELEAASELVSEDFTFRGALGTEVRGRAAFLEYVRTVRATVGDYRAEILACVTEGDAAFAKMRFSGIHVGPLRGYAPTGRRIEWLAAALFRFDRHVIVELWVLGDLAGLDAMLAANSRSS